MSLPARRAGRVALVLGDIDLVRPLALAGIRSASVAVAADPTRFSRYVEPVAIWDPDATNDALVDTLVAWGAAQRERPVLYYQWDGHLRFVSDHRARLGAAFRFVIDDAARIDALIDKERFLALAERLHLPTPPARALHPATATPRDARALGYPLLVKPVARTDDRWKHFARLGKAYRVGSEAELAQLWPQLVAFDRPVLVQRLVPGPESCIESYHVFAPAPGEIAAEFTGRKVRTTPAAYGATTALTITDAPDLVATGREVIGALGLTGVAKLDFKRAPDGRLYLLEVNPRFNLWHHPGAVAGVNIPALVYDYLDGVALPAPAHARAGVTWCSPYDVASARRPRELLERLRFGARCEAKAIWARDDPLPLLGTLATRATSAARRRLSSTRAA